MRQKKRTKDTWLRCKRDDAVSNAKSFARAGSYKAAEIWLRRATSYMPLSPFQIWAIKKIIGEYKFEELHFDKLPVKENRP